MGTVADQEKSSPNPIAVRDRSYKETLDTPPVGAVSDREKRMHTFVISSVGAVSDRYERRAMSLLLPTLVTVHSPVVLVKRGAEVAAAIAFGHKVNRRRFGGLHR